MNAQINIQKTRKSLSDLVKERTAVQHIPKLDFLTALLIFLSIALSACGVVPAGAGVIPLSQPKDEQNTTTVLPPITEPGAARDVAINFIQANYGQYVSPAMVNWDEGEILSGELAGSTVYQYTSGTWTARVSFPLVAPESTIYTIRIQEVKMGFSWEGLVDAYGQAATTYIAHTRPTTTQERVEPTPTAIPPTSTPIPTRLDPTPTPIPPTPTPLPVPCNVISFQADLTIKDGTIFAPNADFTKTWRLKNIGTCSWNTNYDLIFVEGDQMNGAKAIALSEKIRPGESLDISVTLTSPSKAGEYRGYWMLRSGDGEWFGYGKEANKPFWVDIEVVNTTGDHKYDFALNLCAGIWRSEDMRLPCPGYTTSQEGFAQLLDEPKLENRNENEIAIWVHPNEDKYGWLEGTFPAIKIKKGDHFKTWVGCIKDNKKCSLRFYLDYKDEHGKIHHLEEWIEEYDGQVTVINLDLSELAGERVHFILGVEALTKNVEDAQGFWFVPHIAQDN